MDYTYYVGPGWCPLLDEGLEKIRKLDPDYRLVHALDGADALLDYLDQYHGD